MKKTVLTFGLIAGAISAIMMMASVLFISDHGTKGLIIGYTTIVLAALLVFFGIRSYRDNVAGGRVTFGRAFAVGILITIISNACYVATWEVVYAKFMPDFADKYAAEMIERAKASGASPDGVEKATRAAADFKRTYRNPAIRMAMTFAEPFPVGLVMTLISAAVLRRKAPVQARASA
ncbi:MAG TPA: DUF4199 domain-containing protein [Candidatus Angelobacter sp.]|nr:DUF4199 domain-containing protein [Candidatus Angelobacter sp.]